MSLNNLGNMFSELGRRKEGLAATAEAVEIYGRLVTAAPGAFGRDFMTSLWNLLNRFEESGRPEATLPVVERAMEIARRTGLFNEESPGS